MNEMTEKEKLFALMAHADDLQKIADASQKDIQAAIAEFKDIAKTLPVEVCGTVSEIADSRLIGPMKQAKVELAQAVADVKTTTKGLWFYPAVIVFAIMIILSGYAYFGLKWITNERDRAKAELAALNHELAQTTNVRQFTTEDGKYQFWVEIDSDKKTGDADGKTWARLPRR